MSSDANASVSSICFVALNSYNLFAQRSDLTHIGGAEVQQFEMAHWLSEQGYRVSVITKDHAQPEHELVAGIHIHRAYAEADGLPLLRFFHPRWSGLMGAMRRANADVYYQRGSGVETGQVAGWCRRHKRRFIYGCASEGDCVPELPFINRKLDAKMYLRGLRLASAVVAQTSRQQSLLREHFNRSAVVIRNVMTPPKQATQPKQHNNNRLKLLWVGRLVSVKRAEWLVEIAGRFPDLDFEVIGSANAQSSYSTDLLHALKQLPNVIYIERLSRDKLFERYQSADAVLCTSIVEGFPNTFIEGWYFGLPTICTYDPDNLVATNGLGWSCRDLDELTEAVADFQSRTRLAQSELSAQVQKFAANTFHPDKALPKLVSLIDTASASSDNRATHTG